MFGSHIELSGVNAAATIRLRIMGFSAHIGLEEGMFRPQI